MIAITHVPSLHRYLLGRKVSPALSITDWPAYFMAQTQYDAKMCLPNDTDTRIDVDMPTETAPIPPLQTGHTLASASTLKHNPYAALSMANTQGFTPRALVTP